MLLPKFRYYAYCYKYKFFYIGWIVRKSDYTRRYSDPDPSDFMICDEDIVYMCFSLTEKFIMRKIEKYVKKHLG